MVRPSEQKQSLYGFVAKALLMKFLINLLKYYRSLGDLAYQYPRVCRHFLLRVA